MPLPEELFEQFDAMQIRQHPLFWDKAETAKNLKKLRETNVNIARYTCKYSRFYKLNNYLHPSPDIPCTHETPYACEGCNEYKKKSDGSNDVSTKILSNEKGLSTWRSDQISALEGGRDLTLEKILFYAYLARVPLSEILVLSGEYAFNPDGIIIKKESEMSK